MTTQENAAASSSLERRIDITVVLADIQGDVDARLKKLSRTVKMAGFRPGKVPFKLVEQNYGGDARSEAIGAAVNKSYSEQVRAQNLRVAGYPQIAQKEGTNEAQLEFTATFEVYPEIALGDLAGQEVVRSSLVVGEEEVEKTIAVLLKQRTVYEETDRAAQNGDRVIVDFVGRKEGVEFAGGKAEDFSIDLGAGRMLPDFEAAVIGLKAGESKTFEMTFPADYQAADLAGNPVQFDVTVKKVEAPKLPELNSELVISMGVTDGDVAKFRQEVRNNLEREVKKRLQNRVKENVMDALLAVNPIEVPKALIEAEGEQLAQNMMRDMEQRGMSQPANFKLQASWFAEEATRRVKLGLILAKLVEANKLEAKPEQVRAVVEDFASTFEQPSEVVHWYYAQPQRLAEAEALALENNVVEWVLAQAKAIDKTIGLEELMGPAA